MGRQLVAAIGLVLVFPGCTVINEFRPSAEICTGRRDEDFDGLIDCDDPDCEGRCSEEGPVACHNLRDDDRDGLLDTDDPRCWPETHLRLDRCRTIDGSAFDLAHNEAFWSADHLYYVPDPVDAGRNVLGVGGRSWGRIRVLDPVTGTWDGLRLRARVYLGAPDPGSTQSGISILLSDFAVRVYRNDTAALDGVLGIDDWTLIAPVPAVDAWEDLAVDVDLEGTVLVAHLTLTRAGQAPLTASYTFAEDWPLAPPLGLDITLNGNALLDALTVTRDSIHTCTQPEPRFASTGLLAMRNPTERCLLSSSGTYRSADGITWTTSPPPSFYASGEPGLTPRGSSWEEREGAYQGVVLTSSGDVAVTTSSDCASWTVGGPMHASGQPALRPHLLSYWGHLRLASERGVSHQIWWVEPNTGAMLVWTSDSGRAGTYVRTPAADLNVLPIYDLTLGTHTPLTPLEVIAVGDERIFVVHSQARELTTTLGETVVQFFVAYEDGSFHEIEALRQQPSHIAGTHDQTDVRSVGTLFAFDRGWSGELVVGGAVLAQNPGAGLLRDGTTLLTFTGERYVTAGP